MDSIVLNSPTLKRVKIERDGVQAGVLEFDPGDVVFAKRFYATYKGLEGKEQEYRARQAELSGNDEKDANGIPVNADERIASLEDVCKVARDMVDELFGAGTAQMVFGDAMNMEMFLQFFDGITPLIQSERSKKAKQYIVPKRSK